MEDMAHEVHSTDAPRARFATAAIEILRPEAQPGLVEMVEAEVVGTRLNACALPRPSLPH